METDQRPTTVLGLGTPLLDIFLSVSEDYLAKIPGQRGGSEALDYESLCRIIQESGVSPVYAAGGSAANTIKGLSHLGQSCALFGKIGKGEAGKRFETDLSNLKIKSLLAHTDSPTGQVVCLITPDQERTMRYFLGAGAQATEADVKPEMFTGVKLVHIEGYLFNNGNLVAKAMELAKAAGALISFDTGSVEMVRAYKKTMVEQISRYVDILFANEEEAHALTGEGPEKSSGLLKDLCHTAVIKMGSLGCWVTEGENAVYQPALKVNVKDTTGAGDLFASGFLHGYLANKPLADCAYYGSLLASQVIQVIGATVPDADWEVLKKQISRPIQSKG